MTYTRRQFGQLGGLGILIPRFAIAAKPNSRYGGVHIGIIAPYSFRGLPSSAEDILKYLVELGISTVELQNQPVEAFAGAPPMPGRLPGGPPPGAPPASSPAPQRGPAPGGPEQGAQRGGRAQLTPEQLEARRKAEEQLWNWRLSAPMDKFRALRKMYNDAGVEINAFKLELQPTWTDEQAAYVFNVARALGASHVTMELSLDASVTKKIGEWADKNQFRVGFHNHTQVKADSWDTALSQSKYLGLNLDVGHYFAATGESPIPLIQKHHARIWSLHLKDRKHPSTPGAPNMPWGQGDTPLREILQLMKKEKFPFPANIELEYPIPEGSDALKEIAKCLKFARDALI